MQTAALLTGVGRPVRQRTALTVGFVKPVTIKFYKTALFVSRQMKIRVMHTKRLKHPLTYKSFKTLDSLLVLLYVT